MLSAVEQKKVVEQKENVLKFYFTRAYEAPHDVAFFYNQPIFNQSWTWSEVWKMALVQAHELRSHGVGRGDRVGVHQKSDWPWEVSQIAVWLIGASVVGIDPNEPLVSYENIYRKTKMRVVLTASDRIHQNWLTLAKKEGLADFKSLQLRWEMTSMNLSSFLNSEVISLDQKWLEYSDKEEAIVIFTSGTTSEPKGIAYSHRQVFLALQSILVTYPGCEGTSSAVCWLPLANLFQRMVNIRSVALGAPIYFVSTPNDILKVLPRVNPDIFVSVPRFYEKVLEGFKSQLAKLPFPLSRLAMLGLEVQLWHWRRNNRLNGIRPEGVRPLFFNVITFVLRPWEYSFFCRFRLIFGSQIQYLVSGSAPLSREVIETYFSLGLPIYEAYGASENIVPISANGALNFRVGSVGKPFRDGTVSLSDEGEILVSGEGVFGGYLQLKSESPSHGVKDLELVMAPSTRIYATGDLGYFDKDGFLYIHGRKSDEFKTSTGKKVIVSEIEKHFQKIPFIDQVLVLGMGRKNPLLFTSVDYRKLAEFLNCSIEEVWSTSRGRLLDLVLKTVSDQLKKSWHGLELNVKPVGCLVLPRRLSSQENELTMNQKLKRRSIERKFQKEFDKLQVLSEANFDFPVMIIESSESRHGDHYLSETSKASHFRWPFSDNGNNEYLVKVWRFHLILLMGIKVILFRVGQGLGFFSERQYQRVVGQVLRTGLGSLKGPLQKLAQMISYLSSEIPEPIREEMGQLLHDSVPVDPNLVRSVIERELEQPLESSFIEFRDKPLSTGSVGQVHWARLHSGEEVAIKVLIPGMEKILESDIKVLKFFAPILMRLMKLETLPQLLDELRFLLIQELDLKREAQCFEWFRKIHGQDQRIVVPKVIMNLCRPKILVTQYVDALSLNEFNATSTRVEKDEIAQLIWETASRSICLFASFNADPHNGNFLVADGKLILVDFGFCKFWERDFIETWKKQILAVHAQDEKSFEVWSRKLGIIHRTDPEIYKKLMKVYFQVLFEPWLNDREHGFNSNWYKRYLMTLYKTMIAVPDLVVPTEFLALTRLYWGIFGIMSEMEVCANFYRLTVPYLEAEIEETVYDQSDEVNSRSLKSRSTGSGPPSAI